MGSLRKKPCWYFEKEEIQNSPSIRGGMDGKVESRYRADCARYIMNLTTKLNLPYNTCATAIVFFHRFYMYHSMKEVPRYVCATCCLFLAGKVEETPKKCHSIVQAAKAALDERKKNEFTEFGVDPKNEVLSLERMLLKTMQFDMEVDHPYAPLMSYVKRFQLPQETTKELGQFSWTLVNDSLATTLCLQWEPEIIACAVVFLACKMKKIDIVNWSHRSSSQSKWWEDCLSGMTLETIEGICHQILDLYTMDNSASSSSNPSVSHSQPTSSVDANQTNAVSTTPVRTSTASNNTHRPTVRNSIPTHSNVHRSSSSTNRRTQNGSNASNVSHSVTAASTSGTETRIPLINSSRPVSSSSASTSRQVNGGHRSAPYHIPNNIHHNNHLPSRNTNIHSRHHPPPPLHNNNMMRTSNWTQQSYVPPPPAPHPITGATTTHMYNRQSMAPNTTYVNTNNPYRSMPPQ